MTPIEQRLIDTLRTLAADAVQQAKSGHPGLPLGAAPMAFALWDKAMRHNPKDPAWANRDRFVLSAGHGSALLYALLHVYGYGVSLEDLRAFRQVGALTPGHPEYRHTPGVETTTGPLGQGIATAVGMAMAEAYLAEKFNKPNLPLVDHYTFALTGDGCLMEGISAEAGSLAGTLGLGKLILLYDANRISIEGNTDIAFREDVLARYRAYGWHTQEIADGNDAEAIAAAVEAAKADARPSIIRVCTEIGFGSPRQGSAQAHGEPLGEEGVAYLKEKLGFDPAAQFAVEEDVYARARQTIARGEAAQFAWNELRARYEREYPEDYRAYAAWMSGEMPDLAANDDIFTCWSGKMATRSSSGEMLAKVAAAVPSLIGGSADLSPSNKSYLKGRGDFSAEDRGGANLHFGVREHAMAAICNGLALHGGLRPYCATFFVFCDYMKHAMRLSALMRLPVLYILTHDSIGVGEDGPTHQPIEHLAMLRSLPGMTTFRPADAREVAAAYAYSLRHEGPVALTLSRQDLPLYEHSGRAAMRGGYILSDSRLPVPDAILIGTGSEVELCMDAQAILLSCGIDARVVSMPSWEVFEKQNAAYRADVLPPAVRARVAVEAASSFGWARYVGLDGACVCIDTFGASGPANELFRAFGFTVEKVVEATKKVCGKA